MQISYYSLDLKQRWLKANEAKGILRIDGQDRKVEYRHALGEKAKIWLDGVIYSELPEEDWYTLFDVFHGNLKGPHLFNEVAKYLESLGYDQKTGFTARVSNGTIRRLIADNDIIIGVLGVANVAQRVSILEHAPWRKK